MRIPILSGIASHPFWQRGGLLIARLIIAAIFAMACFFKFRDIGATAGYIDAAGFPLAAPLAWIAAICELLLMLAFLTGILMREAALLAAIYILFLAFSFHGPNMWGDNHMEFGMTAFGPGPLGLRR